MLGRRMAILRFLDIRLRNFVKNNNSDFRDNLRFGGISLGEIGSSLKKKAQAEMSSGPFMLE